MQETEKNSSPRPREVKRSTGDKILFTLLKHVFLACLAFMLALIMILLTMDKVIMPYYQRSGKETVLPDITGVTVEQAEKTLMSKKLFMKVEKSEYNNDFPRDTISLQIPSPGTIVKSGRNIRVIISLGSRPIKVPNVVGMSPRNARFAIQGVGLSIRQEGWIPSNDYPNGIVAEQEPKGNEEVPENTGVILYISNGKKVTNVVMPNLINLSLSAAKDTLSVYGFSIERLKVQTEEQSDLLPDTVIEQYPDPGVPAHTNDEVVLVVSKTE